MDAYTDAFVASAHFLHKKMEKTMEITSRKQLCAEFVLSEENKQFHKLDGFFAKNISHWNSVISALINSNFPWLDKARIFRMSATPVLDPELKKIFEQECKITFADNGLIMNIDSNDGKGVVRGNYDTNTLRRTEFNGLLEAQESGVKEYLRLKRLGGGNDNEAADDDNMDTEIDAYNAFVRFLHKKMEETMRITPRIHLGRAFAFSDENEKFGMKDRSFTLKSSKWNLVTSALIKSNFSWLDKARILRMTSTPVLDPELKKILEQECKITLMNNGLILDIDSNDGKREVQGNYDLWALNKTKFSGLLKTQTAAVKEYQRLKALDGGDDKIQEDDDNRQEQTDEGEGISKNDNESDDDGNAAQIKTLSVLTALKQSATQLGCLSDSPFVDEYNRIAKSISEVSRNISLEQTMDLDVARIEIARFLTKIMNKSTLIQDASIKTNDLVTTLETTTNQSVPSLSLWVKHHHSNGQNKYIENTVLIKEFKYFCESLPNGAQRFDFEFGSRENSVLMLETENQGRKPPAKKTKMDHEVPGLPTGPNQPGPRHHHRVSPFDEDYTERVKKTENRDLVNQRKRVRMSTEPVRVVSPLPTQDTDNAHDPPSSAYPLQKHPALQYDHEALNCLSGDDEAPTFDYNNTNKNTQMMNAGVVEKDREPRAIKVRTSRDVSGLSKDICTTKGIPRNKRDPLDVYCCQFSGKRINPKHIPCYEKEIPSDAVICIPCGIVYARRGLAIEDLKSQWKKDFDELKLDDELYKNLLPADSNKTIWDQVKSEASRFEYLITRKPCIVGQRPDLDPPSGLPKNTPSEDWKYPDRNTFKDGKWVQRINIKEFHRGPDLSPPAYPPKKRPAPQYNHEALNCSSDDDETPTFDYNSPNQPGPRHHHRVSPFDEDYTERVKKTENRDLVNQRRRVRMSPEPARVVSPLPTQDTDNAHDLSPPAYPPKKRPTPQYNRDALNYSSDDDEAPTFDYNNTNKNTLMMNVGVVKKNGKPPADNIRTNRDVFGLSTELGNSVANVEEMDGKPQAKRTKTEYEKCGLSTGFSIERNKLGSDNSSRSSFETLFCQETNKPIDGASIPCYDTESLFKNQICIPCGIVCQNRSRNVESWKAALEKLNLNPRLFMSPVPAYRDEEKKMWAVANVESTYIINRRLYKISELPQLESCKIEMIKKFRMKTKTPGFYEYNTLFSNGRWCQELVKESEEEQFANPIKDSVTQKEKNISHEVYYCQETQKQISQENVPCYTRENMLKNKICVPCGIVYQTREIPSKKKDAVRRSIFEKKNLKPELFQSQTTKLPEDQKQYWRVSNASYSSGRYSFSWRLYEAIWLPYHINCEKKIIEQFQMELKSARFKERNYIYDNKWEQNFSKVNKDGELAIHDEAYDQHADENPI